MAGEAEFTLADLPLEERRALPYNHPLLDQYASQVEKQIGMPGLINALKNAGEKSQSGDVSPKGAKGVMQFIDGTAKRYGLSDPTDPLAAIEAAGRYVKDISGKLNTTDPGLIAAAYNAGENRKDIMSGRIPGIPETQKYVARVNQYLQAPPAAAAGLSAADVPQEAELTLDDLPEAGRKQHIVKNAKAQVKEVSPLATGPTEIETAWGYGPTIKVPAGVANALAGSGKFMTDTWKGISQLSRDTINTTNRALGGQGNLVDDLRAEEAERMARDAPLMKDPAALGGYLGTAILTSALPIANLGNVGAAKTVISTLPKVLQPAAGAAVTGAGMGLASPVTEEGERFDNMTTGAAFGALGSAAGQLMGKATDVPLVRQGKEWLKGHMPVNIPGILQRPIISSLPPQKQAAALEAAKAGVPVYRDQIKDPRAPIGKRQSAEQREALDKAFSGAVGKPGVPSVQAWPEAREAMTQRYNQLLDNKQIPLDFEHLADIGDIIKKAQSRQPRFKPNKDLMDDLKRAWDAANTGPMTGREYQEVLRQYSANMAKLKSRTDTKAADHFSANLYKELMDSLTKQAEKTMSKRELGEFRTLNKQWRDMKTLESAVPKDLGGQMDPTRVASLLASKQRDGFVYGQGDQYLPNLSRFGTSFMDPMNAEAPKMGQKLKHWMLHSAPYAAMAAGSGAAVGAAIDHATESPEDSIIRRALPYGGAIGLALLGNRLVFGKPRETLTAAELRAMRGILAEANQMGVTGGALSRAVSQERMLQEEE